MVGSSDELSNIITAARENSGYFDHPRKINAGILARKIGMHKTTLLEHLHKAQKRLIGHIIEHTV
jgi:predicted DNA binding protein